jgi:hypothetical protein
MDYPADAVLITVAPLSSGVAFGHASLTPRGLSRPCSILPLPGSRAGCDPGCPREHFRPPHEPFSPPIHPPRAAQGSIPWPACHQPIPYAKAPPLRTPRQRPIPYAKAKSLPVRPLLCFTHRRISLRTGRVRKISVEGKGVLKRKQMLAVRARDPARHPTPDTPHHVNSPPHDPAPPPTTHRAATQQLPRPPRRACAWLLCGRAAPAAPAAPAEFESRKRVDASMRCVRLRVDMSMVGLMHGGQGVRAGARGRQTPRQLANRLAPA